MSDEIDRSDEEPRSLWDMIIDDVPASENPLFEHLLSMPHEALLHFMLVQFASGNPPTMTQTTAVLLRFDEMLSYFREPENPDPGDEKPNLEEIVPEVDKAAA